LVQAQSRSEVASKLFSELQLLEDLGPQERVRSHKRSLIKSSSNQWYEEALLISP
jgi:hypothetical protein